MVHRERAAYGTERGGVWCREGEGRAVQWFRSLFSHSVKDENFCSSFVFRFVVAEFDMFVSLSVCFLR